MGFGKNGTGAIIKERNSVALGTLGQNIAIKIDGASVAITEDFRLLKSEIFCEIDALTSGEGSGLMLGIADDELSTAEIAEAINLSGPVDRNDNVNTERAMRPVWLISALDELGGATVGRFHGKSGGSMMEWKKRWTFSNPEGWVFFVWNEKAALTTGATARLVATHYGVWLA